MQCLEVGLCWRLEGWCLTGHGPEPGPWKQTSRHKDDASSGFPNAPHPWCRHCLKPFGRASKPWRTNRLRPSTCPENCVACCSPAWQLFRLRPGGVPCCAVLECQHGLGGGCPGCAGSGPWSRLHGDHARWPTTVAAHLGTPCRLHAVKASAVTFASLSLGETWVDIGLRHIRWASSGAAMGRPRAAEHACAWTGRTEGPAPGMASNCSPCDSNSAT